MTTTHDDEMMTLSGRPHLRRFSEIAILLCLGTIISLFAVGGPWDISLAAWMAPVLLLRFSRLSRIAVSVCGIFLVSVIQFAVYSATSGVPFSTMTVILSLVLGAIFSIPYILDRVSIARLPTAGRILMFPVAATVVECVSATFLPLGTSVGTRAVTQAENLALLQVISVLGPYSIAFLIGAMATAFNHVWENPNRAALVSVGLPFGVAFLTVLLLGQARLTFANNRGAIETVKIAGVVPRIDLRDAAKAGISMEDFAEPRSSDADFSTPEMKLIYARVKQEMFADTMQVIAAGAQVVMWSETALPVLEADKTVVLDQIALVARQNNVFINAAFGVAYERNETFLIGPDGVQKWHYRKNHPVPGMEPVAPFANDPPVVATRFGDLTNVICFDADFPTLSRVAADIMLVPAWDWPEVGYTHTLKNARLRSVENGYSMVRIAYNGFSAAFDPYGQLLAFQSTLAGSRYTMVVDVPVNGVRTIYSRTGDLFAYLAFAAIVGLGLLATTTRRKRQAA